MKKLLILSGFVFSFLFVNAQNWDSLNHGIISYSPGSALGGVYAQTQFQNNLYAAGDFNYAGGRRCNGIAEWNGTSWSVLDSGLNNEVNALCVYNGLLYAGGRFDSSGILPVYTIAAWNGILWAPVGLGISYTTNAVINALCIYNGELYAGGYFDSAGGMNTTNIAKWNGTAWASVGTGIRNSRNNYVPIDVLCTYNGELYAGGTFDSAGSIAVNNIAKWNGTTWTAVNGGISKNGSVLSMAVFNNLLYVGGQFDSAGGQPGNNIAMWNGTTWAQLGTGIPYNLHLNHYVFGLCVYDSAVCVGGIFDTAGGIPAKNIAYWNGATWGTFGSGMNGYVYSLYNFNAALFAAGTFTNAGGTPANNIAQWRTPLGINNLQMEKGQVSVFPNPNNGGFTLTYQLQTGQTGEFTIYNMLGEKLAEYTLDANSDKMNINASTLSEGIYLYRISVDNNIVKRDKIVIIK